MNRLGGLLRHPPTWWLWLSVACFAVVYAWGLNNAYMPTNGDEMVYAHIARLTAESQQWLPLASDLPHMRNTKPPLLFWQAMVAGAWGEAWQLWCLRAPSLVYLALLAVGMTAVLHRWVGEWRTPAWALLCLFASWGTFRYGRPFLTTAPEMFWFSLPLLHVLWRSARTRGLPISNNPGEWLIWTGWGVLLGVGLGYKSFALVAPVVSGVWAVRLLMAPTWSWRDTLVCSMQMAWMGLLAVGVIASWLLLDPQPEAVWREFVVGENMGKMNDAQGYWTQLLSLKGAGAYALAHVENAGLLAPVVMGVYVLAWRHRTAKALAWRGNVSAALVVWLGVWWLVFLIPSQRSARYLLPTLPAMGMLMALHIHRLPAWAFKGVNLLSLLMLGVLSWLAWHAHALGLMPMPWAVLLALVVMVALGMAWFAWSTSEALPLAALLSVCTAFVGLNALLQGHAGERVAFQGETADRPVASTVWVPAGFNGDFERFQFLLPRGNRFVPLQDKVDALTQGLDTTSGTWFIVARLNGADPLPCEASTCERVAVRWDIELRLKPGQVNGGNIARPAEWLWRQEWLMRVR
jgi:hypothetical protein